MAAGTTTVSGGFKLSDTTGIKNFVQSIVSATVSGAQVWTYVGANQQVWIGVTEQTN